MQSSISNLRAREPSSGQPARALCGNTISATSSPRERRRRRPSRPPTIHVPQTAVRLAMERDLGFCRVIGRVGLPATTGMVSPLTRRQQGGLWEHPSRQKRTGLVSADKRQRWKRLVGRTTWSRPRRPYRGAAAVSFVLRLDETTPPFMGKPGPGRGRSRPANRVAVSSALRFERLHHSLCRPLAPGPSANPKEAERSFE